MLKNEGKDFSLFALILGMHGSNLATLLEKNKD